MAEVALSGFWPLTMLIVFCLQYTAALVSLPHHASCIPCPGLLCHPACSVVLRTRSDCLHSIDGTECTPSILSYHSIMSCHVLCVSIPEGRRFRVVRQWALTLSMSKFLASCTVSLCSSSSSFYSMGCTAEQWCHPKREGRWSAVDVYAICHAANHLPEFVHSLRKVF